MQDNTRLRLLVAKSTKMLANYPQLPMSPLKLIIYGLKYFFLFFKILVEWVEEIKPPLIMWHFLPLRPAFLIVLKIYICVYIHICYTHSIWAVSPFFDWKDHNWFVQDIKRNFCCRKSERTVKKSLMAFYFGLPKSETCKATSWFVYEASWHIKTISDLSFCQYLTKDFNLYTLIICPNS